MNLLTPLGLLGLTGLIVLLIIYLIKPNYQNKIISSTFVWNLSLKYRKKKLPINKLRNLLLILCQILIIASSAFILAKPFIPEEKVENKAEKVVIIDVSASMLAETGGENRIDRTVDQVLALAKESMEKEQSFSVIIASDESYFLAQEIGPDKASELYDAIESISDPADPKYTYGTPDIEGAIKLAEEITAYSSDVEVLLYTDTSYINSGKVKVVNVNDPADWNAAILDVRATLVENYYVFEIDVASYGRDTDIMVYCDIEGTNDAGGVETIQTVARCSNNEITTLVFANYVPPKEGEEVQIGMEEPDEVVSIFSFENMKVRIDEPDSLEYDNEYFLYGGSKPTLKVQYYSSLPNNYFSTALMVLRDQLKKSWNIEITEVRPSYSEDYKGPATEGFDIYIYEHEVPKNLPIDGVVILSDPDHIPQSAGITLGDYWMPFTGAFEFSAEDPHPIMNNIVAEEIECTLYKAVKNYDGFTPLMSCDDGVPIVLVKDEIDAKMVVMTFSLNYSNFSMLKEFPLFLYNVFNYFAPATLTDHVYEINDTVTLNSRGDELFLEGPDTDIDYNEFPAELVVTKPGVYTATQILISGEEDSHNFFVKLTAEESNVAPEKEELENPYYYEDTENNDLDLLIYFAIALVALLFAEWWLKSREQF